MSLVVLLSCGAPAAHGLCVEVGKEIPDITLPDIDGGKVFSLASQKGKIVLVSFWASWCPRCEQELTFLEGVYKTSPDIVVVAINEESRNITKAHIDRIKRMLQDWKIDFPVLVDHTLEAWNRYCINSLPASIIIDKSGVVRYAESNYYWATQGKIAEVIQAIRLGK